MPKVEVTTAKGLIEKTGAAAVSLGSGLAIGVQNVEAAGDAVGNAGAISVTGGGLVLVTAADDAKGVALPALSDVPPGTTYFILNLVSNKTLEIYPQSGDQIHPLTNSNPITVAAKGMLICIADAAKDEWASAEPAATGA